MFRRSIAIIVGLAFFLISSFWTTEVSRNLSKIPDDFGETVLFIHTENNRFDIEGDWSGKIISSSKVRTKSTVISSSELKLDHSFTAESISGEVLFDLNHSILVNRYTRHNLPGGSDENGVAYSYFPPNTQKQSYLWWPATFGSPFNMNFVEEQTLNGLKVYRFESEKVTIDDTIGYEFLPLVPEKYKAYSNASIEAYVEPVTGTLVKYADQGVSYYGDDKLVRIWDIAQWSNVYSQDTINQSVIKAKDNLVTFSFHHNIIPFILFGFGVFHFYLALFTAKKQ